MERSNRFHRLSRHPGINHYSQSYEPFEGKRGLGFHIMISLRQLDGKQVGVSIPLKDSPVWVYGLATFLPAAEGPLLKITVSDSTGSFDILIKEADWTGVIQRSSDDPRAEFLIRLTAPDPCGD